MSVVTIFSGQQVIKDPADVKVITFDWDSENLAASVTIASQTVTITAVSPYIVTPALTATTTGTGLGIQAGNRTVKVKLSAGTLGSLYAVTNTIVTNETPAQTKERSFFVLVENL